MKMQNPLKRLQSRGLLGNCKNFIVVLAGFIFLPLLNLEAQTVIGGSTPDPSAMLDVQSQTKGVLFPRLTTAARNLLTNAPTGLMIFNTSENRLQINLGTPGNASWQNINPKGSIFNLDCASAVLTGSLFSGQAASGVSVSIAYTDGDGQSHGGQTVNSTGVTGLTATLSAGSFATGAGNLIYNISGTPSATGTASFALTIGGQNCTLTLTVQAPFTISCTDAIRKGEMQPNFNASGVSVIVPYTNATGQAHTGQSVTSTGITGYTATLAGGNFGTGSGTLTYDITGMATAAGTATFALNIGGSSCNLDLEVKSCSASISGGVTKTFLCYNLGAYNTRASSSAPSWEINGDYWRWGTKIKAADGPTGPGGDPEANSGAITGWASLPVGGNGAWVDNNPMTSNPMDNPCPAGFRVPTETQWRDVINNNSISNVGSSWSPDPTSYSTGKNFGLALFLPTAGYRGSSSGTLIDRDNTAYYWSSTEFGTGDAWGLRFLFGGANLDDFNRARGFSVRCISE